MNYIGRTWKELQGAATGRQVGVGWLGRVSQLGGRGGLEKPAIAFLTGQGRKYRYNKNTLNDFFSKRPACGLYL